MENFIRAVFISILVGTISISFAQDQDNDLDTALAASLGLTLMSIEMA